MQRFGLSVAGRMLLADSSKQKENTESCVYKTMPERMCPEYMKRMFTANESLELQSARRPSALYPQDQLAVQVIRYNVGR